MTYANKTEAEQAEKALKAVKASMESAQLCIDLWRGRCTGPERVDLLEMRGLISDGIADYIEPALERATAEANRLDVDTNLDAE